jgi:hypothetical protein
MRIRKPTQALKLTIILGTCMGFGTFLLVSTNVGTLAAAESSSCSATVSCGRRLRWFRDAYVFMPNRQDSMWLCLHHVVLRYQMYDDLLRRVGKHQ